MTLIAINVRDMPKEDWRISVQEQDKASQSLSSQAIRSVFPKTNDAASGISKSSAKSQDEILFDNSASLKLITSKLVMHLSDVWRNHLRDEIDILLDIDDWEDDSSEINVGSYSTFLRFVIYGIPTKLPSLGVSPAGQLTAVWWTNEKKVEIEFYPKDKVKAFLLRPTERSREAALWTGEIVDLKSFIERFGNSDCLR